MTTDDQQNSMIEEKRSLLIHALGGTISRWANVEYQLVAIFATATQIPLPLAAKILGSVKTFRLLADMCHSAVRYRLRDYPELVYWNSLFDYATALSADRNYMVHNALVVHHPEPPPQGNRVKLGPDTEVKIGPGIGVLLAGQTEKITPLNQNELTELGWDFQELIEMLMGFNEWLSSSASSPKIYRAQVVRRRPQRSERRAGEGKE